MAKNYIVINSKFKPFSYQEMLQPVAQATEVHKDIETQIGDVSQQADMLKGLLNEQTDRESFKRYKDFSTNLETQASELASQGLTQGSMQNLINLKRNYATQIVPIQNAYNKRQEDIKAQQDLRIKDSSLMFDRDARVTSLDQYLENPDLGFNSLSANEIYSTASKDFANLAKNIQQGEQWNTILGGQYYERKIQEGYTPEQIGMLVAQDENAPKELKDLYDSTLETYMSRGQWDEQQQQSIRDAINRSASYGIGNVKTDIQSNKAYVAPSVVPPVAPEDDIPDVDLSDIDQVDYIRGTNLNKYITDNKYITKDAKLTSEGQNLIKGYYDKSLDKPDMENYYDNGVMKSVDRNIKRKQKAQKLIKDLGIDNVVKDGKISTENINKHLQAINENQEYDGMLTRHTRFHLGKTTGESITSKLASLGENMYVEPVIGFTDDGDYKFGDGMSATEFKARKSDNYTLTYDNAKNTLLMRSGSTDYKIPLTVLPATVIKELKNNAELLSNPEYLDATIAQTLGDKDFLTDIYTPEQKEAYRKKSKNRIIYNNHKMLQSIFKEWGIKTEKPE